jgi:hypothetical protein
MFRSSATHPGMSEKSTLTSEQCRAHAKACRDMARTETHEETRKRLDDLATSWERLCEEIEAIAKRAKEQLGSAS